MPGWLIDKNTYIHPWINCNIVPQYIVFHYMPTHGTWLGSEVVHLVTTQLSHILQWSIIIIAIITNCLEKDYIRNGEAPWSDSKISSTDFPGTTNNLIISKLTVSSWMVCSNNSTFLNSISHMLKLYFQLNSLNEELAEHKTYIIQLLLYICRPWMQSCHIISLWLARPNYGLRTNCFIMNDHIKDLIATAHEAHWILEL